MQCTPGMGTMACRSTATIFFDEGAVDEAAEDEEDEQGPTDPSGGVILRERTFPLGAFWSRQWQQMKAANRGTNITSAHLTPSSWCGAEIYHSADICTTKCE